MGQNPSTDSAFRSTRAPPLEFISKITQQYAQGVFLYTYTPYLFATETYFGDPRGRIERQVREIFQLFSALKSALNTLF